MKKDKQSFSFKGLRDQRKKVLVAMSGGIDSSVAAALLKKQGFNVAGVFMKFWTPLKDKRKGGWNRCCSPESEVRARKVAKILKIPFYVFDFEKDFKKRIVDCFLKESKKGLTPNPCVNCNKKIKFGLFLEKALKIGADFIATGHYARKDKNIRNKNWKLLKAKDKEKDQSYFLWQLSQKQLKRVLFPIGDYTRAEVEKMAEKFKLPFKKVKKSQEICFVPETVEVFLKQYFRLNPGQIINSGKKALGRHQGLWFYTIGQRKGIGLSGGPYFVLAKDLKKNILIITKKEKDLLKKELIAKNVSWVSGKKPKLPLRASAKIRYCYASASAVITEKLKNKSYKLIFAKPQRAITSGQSVVFYQREELLGGGIIY
jgi:tRNA-uridine 2-sulfurtransferase